MNKMAILPFGCVNFSKDKPILFATETEAKEYDKEDDLLDIKVKAKLFLGINIPKKKLSIFKEEWRYIYNYLDFHTVEQTEKKYGIYIELIKETIMR